MISIILESICGKGKIFFFPIKTLKGRPAPRLLLEKRALAPLLVTKGCQSQGLRWSPHGEAGGEGTGLPPAAVSEAAGGSEQTQFEMWGSVGDWAGETS